MPHTDIPHRLDALPWSRWHWRVVIALGVTWILDGDDARERFFAGAGLGPSGRSRTLAAGEREVREQRWSAEL